MSTEMKDMAKYLLGLLLTSTLVGCGSSGTTDEIARPAVAITNLVGIWKNPNPVCYRILLDDGSWRQIAEGPVKLTERIYQESYLYYEDQDINCLTATGAKNYTYSIDWHAPISTETKTGAVRSSLTGPTISASGNIVHYDAQLPPITIKALFHEQNGTLTSYFEEQNLLVDTEGYPLGTDTPSSSYVRSSVNQ